MTEEQRVSFIDFIGRALPPAMLNSRPFDSVAIADESGFKVAIEKGGKKKIVDLSTIELGGPDTFRAFVRAKNELHMNFNAGAE